MTQADAVRALAEDMGSSDLTAALIDPALEARAQVPARDSAVLCGRATRHASRLALHPAG